MITIIEKIELGEDNGQYFLQNTAVGYTENVHLITEINEQYDTSLGAFLGTNRTKLELGVVSINTFFDNVAYVNEARATTEDVSGLGLIEITDINQL